MQLFLGAEDSEADLQAELAGCFRAAPVHTSHPLLFELDLAIPSTAPLPHVAFARQLLPHARPVNAESISDWVRLLFDGVVGSLPDDQPWSLHVEPHYGARPVRRLGARAWHTARQRGGQRKPEQEPDRGSRATEAGAGQQRSHLIRAEFVELLRKKRRHLLRLLNEVPQPFPPDSSLVQLLLTGPTAGFLSVAPAPVPFLQRHLISAFPKGEITVPSDQAAPSRAFMKLVEAELRMGHRIQAGDVCVDLGAAPGSWTYVAVDRGATVFAVDRSPLRSDLMANPRVQFKPGDAFDFRPAQVLDWLLCDVIAPPDRSAGLLLEWLRRAWCRKFVVTIKLKDEGGLKVLESLKRELPGLTTELFLTHLCANKKEVCAFGRAK